MKQYTTTLVEEDGDIVFNFPEEVLEELKIEVGDTVEWLFQGDYVIMKKVDPSFYEDSSS